MKRFLLNLSINIIAVLAAVWLVPGIDLRGAWWGPAFVALVLGLINTGVRPLLTLVALPFVIASFGLFMLVINALMLYLTSGLVQSFGIDFSIRSFGSAVLGAIVIGVVGTVLRLASGESRVQIEMRQGPQR
ncbi:MAG TPA: phage holin family protein [Herpetosiphonaceae bacterium]|nr:phage holin family protein [Herpetosiphonaceae bacterium]